MRVNWWSRLRSLANIVSRPSHVVALAKHYTPDFSERNADIALDKAMAWLARSQDVTKDAGSSAGYSMKRGWLPSYPETTGYIITTFLRFADNAKDRTFLERAESMGEWQLEIQLPSGGVRGGKGINEAPVVFNTGQVILGLLSLYRKTGTDPYLDAARRAGEFLVRNQEPDGSWVNNTAHDRPVTYHSRVAWPLLELAGITGDESYRDAAVRNIRWISTQGLSNGFIRRMSFRRGEDPLTHTIAYTIRGLFECGCLLEGRDREVCMELVERASEALLFRVELNKPSPRATIGYPSARFGAEWNASAKYSCLVGNAQIALLFLKLYQADGDARFLNCALKLIDLLLDVQDTSSSNAGINGGIAGSYPIWGQYFDFCYPNWAAKFFADCLMEVERVMFDLREEMKRR